MKSTPTSPLTKALFLLFLMVIGASLANPAQALQNPSVNVSGRMAIASNDDFDNAMTVTEIPFRITLDAFEATVPDPNDDPASTKCGLNPGLATVWYTYTPATDILVHMDTIGSNYDTYLAVWTGLRGSLTEVACNDDASPTEFASALDIQLIGGTTYYIEVAQFNNTPADEKIVDARLIPEVSTSTTIHVFRLVRLIGRTFKSNGNQDGFVIESNETSGIGLIKNSTLPYIKVGDDEKKRQARSFLSFNTADLPDTAVVTYAVIKVKLDSIVGQTTLFTAFGGLKVDIRQPYFGTGLTLLSSDFNAAASGQFVGTFGSKPVSGWYSVKLNTTAFPYFNRLGFTQFRLRFAKDDDDDTVADYVRFHSGNSVLANRPVLIIRYYEP